MNFERHERIEGRHLNEETIWLGDEWADCIVKSRLENCHLVVDATRSDSRIIRSQLHGCTIEVKRKMKNSTFFGSDYVGCTFKGKFSGVDFGRSPWPNELTKQLDSLGDVLNCDFTHATLDLCRFFNVDLSRQRFAPWPQFVIPASRRLAALQMNRVWPGKFASYIALAREQNVSVTGLTGTAADFKKHYAINEEELKQALSDIGDVIC